MSNTSLKVKKFDKNRNNKVFNEIFFRDGRCLVLYIFKQLFIRENELDKILVLKILRTYVKHELEIL
jgi:hypothetical protein